MLSRGAPQVPERAELAGQFTRFVLVGAFCALVDYGVYTALLALDTQIHLAKAVSFVAGTTTAYLLNRRFTFSVTGGASRFAGFVLLYATTFAVNVGINALALAVLPAGGWRITLAWMIAQGTATAINFSALRLLVFRPGSPTT